jgi:hypothetical protein
MQTIFSSVTQKPPPVLLMIIDHLHALADDARVVTTDYDAVIVRRVIALIASQVDQLAGDQSQLSG